MSYDLTVGMLNKKKFKRDQDFHPDRDIATGSGHYRDYKSSGYRRGHLVPSADMAWKKKAMDATFLLSNIAPMRAEFNDGIWLELEHNVRDWGRRYKQGYSRHGASFFQKQLQPLGITRYWFPNIFYKAIFTAKDQQPDVIAFLFDQYNDQPGSLTEYVVSVDSFGKTDWN